MADTVYELVAKISVDSSGVDQGLSETKTKIENSGVTGATQDVEEKIARSSYLASAAVVAGGAAIAKGIYSAGKALVGFATDSAAYADNLITMSTVTGLSTEALQEYTYMAELVDVSVDTITGSMAKLTKTMASARDGGEKQMAAFEKLGVQVTDSEGRLRDNNDVFLDVIDALNGMEEGAERDAIIMEIFGRSAQQLNPLIAQGRTGIERFAEEARELGFVLDDETLASLGALDDTMQRLQMVKLNIRNQLGLAMAPALERILDKLLEVSGKIDWTSIGEKLGNALETGADKLIGFIENVDIDKLISGASTLMEGLINGISWILEHSEEIMKLIRDIGIGLVAGKGFNILSGLFGGGGSGGGSGGLSILSKVFSGGAKAAGATGATGAAGATGGASALGGFLSSGWGALALPFMEVLGLGKGAWDYFSTRREMMAGATLGDGASIEEMQANVERLTGVYEEAKAFYDSRQGELYGDMPDGKWLLSQATAEYDAARDALNAAQAELDAALATTSDSAASAGDEVSTEMTALSGEASTWGTDMMNNFASGIIAGANGSVLPAVLSVATGIAALLHHSEPDKGPLAHDSEWMPDMMAGFAKGIRDNRGMVLGELDSLAADMSTSMSAPAPSVSGFGGVGGNVINFAPSIHIDGDITDPRRKAEELMVYMREIFIREAYA